MTPSSVKPLVFVHGFMGGSLQWKLQSPLTPVRQLIFLDLPGFGLNAHIDPIDRIEKFASWCLAELTKMNISRFDLLGHSMGGMIVQEMICQAPERVGRLILYGTGAMGEMPGRFETIDTSKERAIRDGAQATARRIAATWFLEMESAKEYLHTSTIAEQSQLPAILAGLTAMKNWSGLKNLAKIQSKTLILWGDCDRAYPWSQVEKLWNTIPDVGVAVVPGCSHAVHLEKPELFNLLIKDFLGEN